MLYSFIYFYIFYCEGSALCWMTFEIGSLCVLVYVCMHNIYIYIYTHIDRHIYIYIYRCLVWKMRKMRAPGFEPGSLGLKRVLDRFVKVEKTGKRVQNSSDLLETSPGDCKENQYESFQGLVGFILFQKIILHSFLKNKTNPTSP